MKRGQISLDVLRRLYVEERLALETVAARLGCSSSVVRRRLISLGIARRAAFAPRYARVDFGGSMTDQAWRIGDLHVSRVGDETVLVKCTSTRDEQIESFKGVFGGYGHIYTDELSLATRTRNQLRWKHV
jgi:hypothetical protein